MGFEEYSVTPNDDAHLITSIPLARIPPEAFTIDDYFFYT
jgi:hypothetical protein